MYIVHSTMVCIVHISVDVIVYSWVKGLAGTSIERNERE